MVSVMEGAAQLLTLLIMVTCQIKLAHNVQVKKFPWPLHGLFAISEDTGSKSQQSSKPTMGDHGIGNRQGLPALMDRELPKPAGQGNRLSGNDGDNRLDEKLGGNRFREKDQGSSSDGRDKENSLDGKYGGNRLSGKDGKDTANRLDGKDGANGLTGDDAKLQKGNTSFGEEGSSQEENKLRQTGKDKNTDTKLKINKENIPVNIMEVVDKSVSYFQNEDFSIYSEPLFGQSVFTVSVTKKGVCQVRIDFEEFVLAAPTAEGECAEESITIHDTIQFCGENKGQHYYVHVPEVPHNINITMKISKDAKFRFMHSLKVAQIDCSSDDPAVTDIIAPVGCTQYFREMSGTITSFNYDGINMYPQNQDYSICVHKPAKSCGIVYKNSPENNKPTSVGRSAMSSGRACMDKERGGDGSSDSGCGEVCLSERMGSNGPRIGDWITIGQGQPMDYQDLKDPLSYKAYYCGSGLGVDMDNSANHLVSGKGVMDFSGGPFVLHFHTDNNNNLTGSGTVPQRNNLGFSIQYLVHTGQCT